MRSKAPGSLASSPEGTSSRPAAQLESSLVHDSHASAAEQLKHPVMENFLRQIFVTSVGMASDLVFTGSGLITGAMKR